VSDDDCKECGLPTEVTKTSLVFGIDYDGSPAIFTLARVRCIRGHHYTVVNEDETLHSP